MSALSSKILHFPEFPDPRMRSRRYLTVVNSRQKGGFASTQNKTSQKDLEPAAIWVSPTTQSSSKVIAEYKLIL